MVLVGPSGCGKSTWLGRVAGQVEINAGSIFIGDRDVTDLPPKDRDIEMVFQNYALYPHMTVGDNMGFALKMAGVPKTERGSSGSRRRRICSAWRTSSTASRRRCRVVSGSGSRWAGRSCGRRRCS